MHIIILADATELDEAKQVARGIKAEMYFAGHTDIPIDIYKIEGAI